VDPAAVEAAALDVKEIAAARRVDAQLHGTTRRRADVALRRLARVRLGDAWNVGWDDFGEVGADDGRDVPCAVAVERELTAEHMGGAEVLLVALIRQAVPVEPQTSHQTHVTRHHEAAGGTPAQRAEARRRRPHRTVRALQRDGRRDEAAHK